MEKSELRKERYLGDGLYAHFDGYHVILRAPRENGDHWVGLEYSVILEFIRYLKSIEILPKE